MLRRKKLYTVCISCILAFVMIFTSAGFGNTVYGNEAENVKGKYRLKQIMLAHLSQ